MPTLQLSNPNGGTWSSVPNTIINRNGGNGAQACGTSSATIAFGGVQGASTDTANAMAEEFNGTSWTAIAGITGYGYGTGWAGAGTASAALFWGMGSGSSFFNFKRTGTTWASSSNNISVGFSAGCGAQNAALSVGGWNGNNNPTNQTLVYNGSVWSTKATSYAHLTDHGNIFSGPVTGSTNSAILCGGSTGGTSTLLRKSQTFNGDTWTTAADLNVARFAAGATGTTGSAFCFGGTGVAGNHTTEVYNGSTWAQGIPMLNGNAFVNGRAGASSSDALALRTSIAGASQKYIGAGGNGVISLSVAEGALANASIASLSASEEGMAFTKVAGAGDTDNASFNISGSNLITLANLDYETKSSYSVRIQASNGSTTYQNVVTIDVSNVNEAPSNIEISLAQIQEGNAVNAIVGQLSAIDPDTGDTSFTFSISGGADAAKFNINGNNLRASEAFNYEAPADANADNIYAIQITAQDAGGLTYVKSFNISVTNNAADDSLSAPSTAPMLGGKYRVDVNGNPKNTPVYVGGTENALPDGSVVRDTATSKKYVKLSGAATNYLEINDVPPVAWNWSEDGAISWDILQDM